MFVLLQPICGRFRFGFTHNFIVEHAAGFGFGSFVKPQVLRLQANYGPMLAAVGTFGFNDLYLVLQVIVFAKLAQHFANFLTAPFFAFVAPAHIKNLAGGVVKFAHAGRLIGWLCLVFTCPNIKGCGCSEANLPWPPEIV